jgi:DNA (cytosine-5)-methyltransferase 1
MNVLDLFSGIGGFSLGLERAGMRTVAFCERDEYCRAVLRKHWPDLPCFDDIHTIDADGLAGLGRIDLVCGGFPCQPFSVAGEQKGKADDRHLWPQMCRVIALARPTWVIGENVAGLIAMALDDVLADLESLGYTARTFVVPACAVGAPHRRDRLWIVATNSAVLLGESVKRDESNRDIRSPEDVADTARELPYGSGNKGRRRTESADSSEDVGDSDSKGRLQPSGLEFEEWRRPSDASWWSAEPDVGRVAHGIPRRVDRLRCLGNAVVPQIPEIIGRAIMRASFS